ncbi:hypothetical protein ACM44_13760 [Chryseobacterium koreense CCUG 49689]|uniref:Uncharacterized protein n=1 Tax=Chryseobacterium koreense CCUG 49689 TaxID=1304281 RepID=A0A0J7IV79_9FLAO|nr:hypothetical protein ACM44_13760 [Chryseobacterium koreense CCUG 49689]
MFSSTGIAHNTQKYKSFPAKNKQPLYSKAFSAKGLFIHTRRTRRFPVFQKKPPDAKPNWAKIRYYAKANFIVV